VLPGIIEAVNQIMQREGKAMKNIWQRWYLKAIYVLLTITALVAASGAPQAFGGG
jgi:hypothetical protein